MVGNRHLSAESLPVINLRRNRVMMMGLSKPSILTFFVIFFGYIIHSLTILYLFYYQGKENAIKWKIQTKNLQHVGQFWGFPLFSSKPNRGPYHSFLITWNLLIASCFAAFTTEASIRGWNRMTFQSSDLSTSSPSSLLTMFLLLSFQIILAISYQSIAEYYWHRIMHWKFFYKYFHKFHHYYKSPEPFDDMYIHPVEAFGYYCILYAPPFLFTIHYYAFIIYMIVMGLCGVLDHSGMKLEIPFLYNTMDHDNHHLKFEVNYSFPFPFMDILHGTYDGVYGGICFQPISDRTKLQ